MTAKKKIIIVGAGIAGLAACKRLIECGFDAVILEARQRSGGRMWAENHLGLPINRGASWIHGVQDNPIAQLALEAHVEMVAMDVNKFVYYDRNGLPIPQVIVEKFNEKFDELMADAKKLAFQMENDISLSDALYQCSRKSSFSSIEQDIFKAKLDRFEDYTGASSQFLSGRHWDDEEYWPGDTCYVLGGVQPIINSIEQHCVIQFSTIVTGVNIDETGVDVITEHEILHADAVIITVSLGVLKNHKIDFNPPLPKEKQKVIERLEMGLLNITILKFPSVFWPSESHALRFSQFDDASISFFFNLHQFNSQSILIGTHGGERAKKLEALSESALIEKTIYNFRQVFGEKVPDPVFYLNTRWSHDPFSYGSYSYIPTEASNVDFDKMATPVANKIFFAGEATSSRYPATMHGAYLSGMREAERIINFYS